MEGRVVAAGVEVADRRPEADVRPSRPHAWPATLGSEAAEPGGSLSRNEASHLLPL